MPQHRNRTNYREALRNWITARSDYIMAYAWIPLASIIVIALLYTHVYLPQNALENETMETNESIEIQTTPEPTIIHEECQSKYVVMKCSNGRVYHVRPVFPKLLTVKETSDYLEDKGYNYCKYIPEKSGECV